MLLACSALPSELQVLLISVTYGNIDVQNCLRNVVSLFHHIEKEIAWRKDNGRNPGFETLQKSKPLVAVGPDHPLADTMLMADFFRECRRRPADIQYVLMICQMDVMGSEGSTRASGPQ